MIHESKSSPSSIPESDLETGSEVTSSEVKVNDPSVRVSQTFSAGQRGILYVVQML